MELWLDNGDVDVESFGNIAQLGDTLQPTGYVMVRVRSEPYVSDDGRVEAVTSQRAVYQKTQPKQ